MLGEILKTSLKISTERENPQNDTINLSKEPNETSRTEKFDEQN